MNNSKMHENDEEIPLVGKYSYQDEKKSSFSTIKALMITMMIGGLIGFIQLDKTDMAFNLKKLAFATCNAGSFLLLNSYIIGRYFTLLFFVIQGHTLLLLALVLHVQKVN